ncbi:hypothetical protein V6N13_117059 [Hibiscus sabdariffa]|uniref:Uncharacterized protein n=1 Tax=Hibiscus sabdariffa TaxID=183260 RepID=A0ABR2QH85_9ROSI
MSSPSNYDENPTHNLIEGSRGRPPETVVALDLPPSLERPRSPILVDVQRDPKKGKSHKSVSVNHGVEGRLDFSEMDTSMLEVEDKSPAVATGASIGFSIPSAINSFQVSPMVADKQATGLKPSCRGIMVGNMVNQTATKAILPRPAPEGNEDLYGPWMQMGSRFNALVSLDLDEDNATDSLISKVQTRDPIVTFPVETTGLPPVKTTSFGDVMANTSLQGALQGSGQDIKMASRGLSVVSKDGEGNKGGSKVDVSGKASVVACRETMIPIRSSLNKDNHVVVRVVDTTLRPALKKMNGRVLPASF